MSLDRNACIAEIQQIVDNLAVFECFANAVFMEAHDLGLQGKKRQLRYSDAKFGNIRKYLQSEARDFLGVKITPKEARNPFSYSGGVEGFLQAYKDALLHIYTTLHQSANRLVSPCCMRHLAAPLYDEAECVKKQYVEVCREIERYAIVKRDGTAAHDLFRVENSAESIHDTMEDKESGGVGYKW